MVHYIVYRVTCLVGGKVYIGKHKTENIEDGYLGSGRALRNAVKKHGRENFIREVLHVFDNSAAMNAKEAELVTEDFCSRSNTYNMKPGGNGGFSRSDAMRGILAAAEACGSPIELSRRGGLATKDRKVGLHSLSAEQHAANGRKGGYSLKGKLKSPEHKAKIRESLKQRSLRAKSKSGDPPLITV